VRKRPVEGRWPWRKQHNSTTDTNNKRHAGRQQCQRWIFLSGQDEATPKETAENAPYFINNKMIFPLGE